MQILEKRKKKLFGKSNVLQRYIVAEYRKYRFIRFISEGEIIMITERLQERAIAYEPRFDQRQDLKDSYLSKQIDTFLGERFNVLLSKYNYEIKNGLMYGQDMDKPFEQVIRSGIEYRQEVGGHERIDKRREEAELEGFLKIQEVMCNKDTPVGTMMLSISPKGAKDSLYQHNFYDIFTLRQAQGKRFVEARRYSSALTIDEYKDKLSPLSFVESLSDDADFLCHPIKIDNVFFESADQIHSYLHRSHNFMSVEEFENVLRACERLKQEYIRTKDPRCLNAIMNKADIEAGIVTRRFDWLSAVQTINQEVEFLGSQPVRQVAAGCGSSGFVSGDKKPSLFSVSDFGAGSDKYGERTFDCPECGKINIRPKDELLKNCQHCGSGKVAC